VQLSRQESFDFALWYFSPIFWGKGIDEQEVKVLDGPLSHTGRLFEIYLVRLIGTPNQKSKTSLSRP
jgi:hypothetical protein